VPDQRVYDSVCDLRRRSDGLVRRVVRSRGRVRPWGDLSWPAARVACPHRAIVLLTNSKARSAADGLLVGAGLVCFLVASLHRGGSRTGDLNPFPWFVAGFILIAFPLAYRLRISRLRRTQTRRDVF
jgi:hypothetical protein